MWYFKILPRKVSNVSGYSVKKLFVNIENKFQVDFFSKHLKETVAVNSFELNWNSS